MRFAQSEICWLLVLLPLLLLLLRLRAQRHTLFVRRLGDPSLLRQTPPRFPGLHRKWLQSFLVLVPFLSIVLALADPRTPHGQPRLRTGTLDVVLVIDVSKSMAAEDYGAQSRLTKAREIAQNLLLDLRGNRVGLVTFAGSSFRQAELTEDLTALEFILKHWVSIDSVGVGGSNTARALETGLALFSEDSPRAQTMLLFSDGGDADEHLEAALTKAAQRGIRIITFGFGSTQPARIPLYDAQRHFKGFMEVDGRTVTTLLNEAPLRHIATVTQGTYERVTPQTTGQGLLAQHAAFANTLTQDEHKIFQPFLLAGLLAIGARAVIARL
jgi:Ca-activated chloride channel family protein